MPSRPAAFAQAASSPGHEPITFASLGNAL
jgi:hypothetical protein